MFKKHTYVTYQTVYTLSQERKLLPNVYTFIVSSLKLIPTVKSNLADINRRKYVQLIIFLAKI